MTITFAGVYMYNIIFFSQVLGYKRIIRTSSKNLLFLLKSKTRKFNNGKISLTLFERYVKNIRQKKTRDWSFNFQNKRGIYYTIYNYYTIYSSLLFSCIIYLGILRGWKFIRLILFFFS